MIKPNLSFFILGNPRSGTSLFRLMLNSHPEVVVPPECGFLQWWYKKYKKWTIGDSSNIEKREAYVDDLFTSKKIETWSLSKTAVLIKIEQQLPENYTQLSSLIYSLYKPNKKGLIGDKNNYYIHEISLLEIINPQAKYIHLVRDGRDVCCSYLNLHTLKSNSIYAPNVSDKLDEIAVEWARNVSKLDDFINEKHGLTIKYEDLIVEPETTLKKVCSFLNISYSSTMLDYYKSEYHDEPTATMDWKSKTKESIDENNIGKYKIELTKNQIKAIETIASNELNKFGYAE